MFRHAIALLAAFTPCFTLSFAADANEAAPAAKVYDGSVGSSPIVMSLERTDDSLNGNYFYRSKRFDIYLVGDAKKGALLLNSPITDDKISLKPDGSGYAGSLTTAKGKTFPVRLRPVGPDAARAAPVEAPDDLDLYERIRLAGLTLKPEKTETYAGKTIRWHVESMSGNRMFRVESGYAAPVMETINKSLSKIQWANVSNYFGCAGAEGGSGVDASDVENPFLSDAYVSFGINESWSCAGAAHPDFGMEAHTFDARSGKELTLDDFLKFGKGPVPSEDSPGRSDYLSKTFAPGLVALLKRFHPKEMTPKKDECDYSDPEVWNYPAWRLTEKGLYVGASFPRAARVCDNPKWSTIPYSALSEAKPQLK